MSIVEADQTFSIRPMQCQRIIEAMRLRLTDRHLPHNEAYPMAALGIDDQHLAVQLKQEIERPVALHSSDHYHILIGMATHSELLRFTGPDHRQTAASSRLTPLPSRAHFAA